MRSGTTIHLRLHRLWSVIIDADIQKECHIELDAESMNELCLEREAVSDGSLVSTFGDNGRVTTWRGFPVVLKRIKWPLPEQALSDGESVYRMDGHRLVSIRYKLNSGRVCWLDDPENDPVWTEGVIHLVSNEDERRKILQDLASQAQELGMGY